MNRVANTQINARDVVEAYGVMLGRVPESSKAVQHHLRSGDAIDLVRNIANSEEFRSRIGAPLDTPSPFLHVNSPLDVRAMVASNVDDQRKPREGSYVNFLGVAVPTFVFDFLSEKGGLLDQVPIPANYHADMAEWAAAIRSIDLAKDRYTMIELGCGWGCWMVNTGFLAKKRGLKIKVLGVEGDPKHVAFAHEVMKLNNIRTDEYSVIRGIAAAHSGTALFPSRKRDEERWGSAPKFGVSREESDAAVASGDYDSLDMISLADVIGTRKLIDLIHIDIQGGEGDLIDDTVELLTDKVGYLLIGTHSRMLEGRIMDTLLAAGWVLEIERPAIFTLVNGHPETTCDGVQGWRNPKFHDRGTVSGA